MGGRHRQLATQSSSLLPLPPPPFPLLLPSRIQEYGDMAARTRQLAQMAQQLMALAGERDVAVGGGWGRVGSRGEVGPGQRD